MGANVACLKDTRNFGKTGVRISGLHFPKCEGILSFCEALSQRNKNAKLSISFLAPKFHLEAIISSKITFFKSIYFLDTISSCN